MKTNKSILSFFLSRSLFLGGGISTLFLYCSKDAYLAIILGTLLGIGIIYIISKISFNNSNYINQNTILRVIYIIYLLFLIFIILTILATFLYSYFLPFTPSLVSCLPFIILASLMNVKSIKKITYVAQVLFVFSLFLIFLKTLLLTNEFDFSNLLPIFTSSPAALFKTSIIFAILSTSPFLTMIDEGFNFKANLKYYLISMATIFIVVLSITIVLGEMVNIYSYPEYSVLRKISLFNFIENIENFISAGWFFDIFISLSIASLKLKETIGVKKNKLSFILIFIILIIVNELIANNFYNSMAIYKIFPWIFAILSIVIIAITSQKKVDASLLSKSSEKYK